jgi:shikimate dehydrogenase
LDLPYNHGVSEQALHPINATTRYCAVYGHPIKHSASPAMHNAGLAALGLNWCYLAFDVYPEHLSQAIAGAKAMNFIGLNLTVPHKLLAMDMVDALDKSARIWGAVNTVCFETKGADGGWRPLREFEAPPAEIRARGFNTDADAIVQALREDLVVELQGAKVLLLGAGGAGRTAALKLASEKVAKLFLVNRTRAKAEAVGAEIRQNWPAVKLNLGYPHERIDLIVNATSLGLKESDTLPLDESSFSLRRASAVYDMIYRPAETLLLKRAKAAGARTANGLSMLLYQGAKALEIWTGQKPPVAVMRQALERNVYGV